MGLLDRLFGRRDRYDDRRSYGYDDGSSGYQSPQAPRSAPRSADEQAIERYRYLLRTAPPEKIEEAHAEAFAQLSPEQRRQVLEQLSAAVPAGERPRADDARTLARAATRAELRQPGILERAFGGGYGPAYGPRYGPGYGGGHPGGVRGGGGGGVGGPGVRRRLPRGLRRRVRRRVRRTELRQHGRRQPAGHRRRPGHRLRGGRRAVRHRPGRRRPVRRRGRGGVRRGLRGGVLRRRRRLRGRRRRGLRRRGLRRRGRLRRGRRLLTTPGIGTYTCVFRARTHV